MSNDDTCDAKALLARVSPAPREPSERARRLIFRYQGTQRVMRLIGGIFLGVGLLCAILFCWGLPVDVAITLAGVHAQGGVTGTSIDTSIAVNDRNPTVVAFTFEVDEQVYRDEVRTLDPTLAAAEPNAPVDVEYARGFPTWARLSGTTYSLFGYVGLVSLLFPASGALLLFFAVRSNRREIRAFSRGTPVLAAVTFRGPDTSTRINGRHPYKIVWEFKTDDVVHTGSISTMKVLELDDLARTEHVVIVHDESDPAINTLYIE